MKNTTWTPQKPPFRKFKAEVYRKHALTSQFIYQLGEGNMIRSVSRDVNKSIILTDIFQQKIAYLKNCLLNYRKITGVGRGIAAIQAGIPERFAVIYMPGQDELVV